MKTPKIRVRVAPSPTGFAHIGTGWMALFNYAFARKNNGTFIVRIDDTDQKRHVEGAEEEIYKGLSWLGLNWDEDPIKGGEFGPYRQSEKLDIYKDWAQKLINNNLAYEDDGAFRFKNNKEDVKWNDLVRGEVSFPGDEVGDFVILKSDGFPTYNFATVVDDIQHKISHVIRGEEHISNTPRQIALYKAFGADIPEFAHLPTIRNQDRKKLSKRRDPVDLRIYKSEGYLPEALVNFLALLGWSHPQEKEIFSLAEFVEEFSLDRVRKSGPIFDVNKLDWMNGQYIRSMSNEELAQIVEDYIPDEWDPELIINAAPLVKPRINKLSDFKKLAGPIFDRPDRASEELFSEDYKTHINAAVKIFEKIKSWNKSDIDDALSKVKDAYGFHTGKFFMDLRIAIFSQKVTPPFNDSIALMKKNEVLERLSQYV